MRRNFEGLGARVHDVVVIGGGITGSCIARDAALRGLSVALVDAGDFSHATSSATTKLVHGGLRYLRTLEVALVRESLAERRIWQTIAPHMVRPVPFILPTRAGDRFPLRLGLALYDLLAFDRNALPPGAERVPGHRALSGTEMLAREPVLSGLGATGALLYYDCQMYAPERLGLECLIDAARHGAHIANYAELVRRTDGPSGLHALHFKDTLSNRTHIVRGRMIVNAGGPWADDIVRRLGVEPEGVRLTRSKGIHLVTRALTRAHALTLAVGAGHLFVIPWRGKSIVGTTDTAYDGDPAEVSVDGGEIDAFLAHVNAALPAGGLSRSDVAFAYAGLRPLIAQDATKETYTASRRAEIVEHRTDGRTSGVFSVIGGKWTTSRALAERAVDRLGHALGRGSLRCRTAHQPLPGALPAQDRAPAAPLAAARTRLEPLYGALAVGVLARARDEPALGDTLAQDRPEIAAQVVYAVETEMAQTLEDVVFRRTGLGTAGLTDRGALLRAAALMAPLLGWDETEIHHQVALTSARFVA